jgi:hypothetical protein
MFYLSSQNFLLVRVFIHPRKDLFEGFFRLTNEVRLVIGPKQEGPRSVTTNFMLLVKRVQRLIEAGLFRRDNLHTERDAHTRG